MFPLAIPREIDTKLYSYIVLERERERAREMGRSNPNKSLRCKKHPKHNQSIGVCPFCLRERLSHLSKLSSTSSSSSFFTYTVYSSSSSSSSDASPYSDGDSELSDSHSPLYHEAKRSRWFLLLKEEKREPPLTKSRSMAFAIDRRKKGEVKEKENKEVEKGKEKEKKKKKKFWFKLSGYIPRRGRDHEGCSLTHSKTLKEKASAKWVLFA